MIKKIGILLYLLVCFIILLSGCETTKGIAHSVGYAVDSTAKGVTKDAKDFWSAILKVDSWMKEELW